MFKFTIGFDAKRAFFNSTGLGNYARALLRELIARAPENEYLLYSPKNPDSQSTAFLDGLNSFSIKTPQTWFTKKFSSWWRSVAITRDLKTDGLDIYHGLTNELPAGIQKGGVKSIVTIADLIFLRYPEYYRPIDRKIYGLKFKSASEKADRVVTISEQTKRDLIEFYKIPKEKIRVVYPGCSGEFFATPSPEHLLSIQKKYNLPKEFLLSVGSIIPRKNLLGLVKALPLLKTGKKIPLVVVGKGKGYKKTIQAYAGRHHLQEQIRFIDLADSGALPAIYTLASLFVYPSFFEGFGIPIIESLTRGTPVITSKRSCLPEAGGPETAYIDPAVPKEIARAIDAVLGDSARQEKMILEGRRYARRFEWKNTIPQMLELYAEVLKG